MARFPTPRQRRQALGLTVKAVARRLARSASYIRAIERGEVASFDVQADYAAVLGLPIDAFLHQPAKPALRGGRPKAKRRGRRRGAGGPAQAVEASTGLIYIEE